ncbi:MAG: hypothetical protein RIT45_4254 [Pseudomonadota bacterium]
MTRRRRVSEAIANLPQRFDTHGLLTQASGLLREHTGDPASAGVSEAQLRFYVERGLVDSPHPEGARQIYGQRQLLQLCAVQILRGVALDLDRIAGVVQGIADDQLKLLCDEPEEASKKAAVMSNWLGMLEKGRYSRADRGETAMLHQPEIERVVAAPPQPPPASVLRQAAPVAPDLDALGLPDAPRAPAGARQNRSTLAHGDAARLMQALGAAAQMPADAETIFETSALEEQKIRSTTPATALHVAPPSLPDAPPDEVPTRPPAPPRPAQRPAGADPGNHTRLASTLPPAPRRPSAPGQPQPSHSATFAMAKTFVRLPVGRGVELHVEVGGPDRDAAEIEAILARVRAALSR